MKTLKVFSRISCACKRIPIEPKDYAPLGIICNGKSGGSRDIGGIFRFIVIQVAFLDLVLSRLVFPVILMSL
jgi:hypothetical protein